MGKESSACPTSFFTDKFYETLEDKKEDIDIKDIKENKKETKTEKEGKEEKKAELQSTYLLQLYGNKHPVYYNEWKKSQDPALDTSLSAFRGYYKNTEKPEEGYVKEPTEDFIELKAQILKLIQAIKTWCETHKIPANVDDDYDRWDKLATKIFHPSFLNDQDARDMYSQGKEYLERIAFELHKENPNLTAATHAITNLYPGIKVCAPGILTNLYIASLEFATSCKEIFKNAKVSVVQQFALDFMKLRYPETREGMEIHYVNALYNYVANLLKMPEIIDEYADRHDFRIEELEKFKELIQSRKFTEQLLHHIVNFYSNLMYLYPMARTTDLELFLEKLKILGPFKGESPEHYIEKSASETEEKNIQLKKPSELHDALKISIMTRMINSGFINQDYFTHIPLDEEKCGFMTFSEYPLKKDLKNMRTPFAYGILKKKVDFILSKTFPRKLIKEIKTPFAYVLYENNLYFISKNPQNCTSQLMIENESDFENTKKHEDALNTIKQHLEIKDFSLDKSKAWETVKTELSPENLQYIAKICRQPKILQLYYLQKTPEDIFSLPVDTHQPDQLDDITLKEDQTIDEESLKKITHLTQHSHQNKWCIDPRSAKHSYFQYRMTSRQARDKQLFTEWMKELDAKMQIATIQILASQVDLRFFYQLATSIRCDVVKDIAKDKKLKKQAYLIALTQKNIPALKKILIQVGEYKPGKKVQDQDIFIKSLAYVYAKDFWRLQSEFPSHYPEDFPMTSKLFARSFEAGNRDFSNIDFQDADFKEMKYLTLESNQSLNFSNARLTNVKNLHQLFDKNNIHKLNLEGAKLTGEQFAALYHLGRRDFRKVDLQNADLTFTISKSANEDVSLDGANLCGATLGPYFFKIIRSKKYARLDNNQIKNIITHPSEIFLYRVGPIKNYNINLNNLYLQNISLSDIKYSGKKLRSKWVFFSGSIFKGGDFNNIAFDNHTILYGLKNCYFENVKIEGTALKSLTGCYFKNIDFTLCKTPLLPNDYIYTFDEMNVIDRKSFDSFSEFHKKNTTSAQKIINFLGITVRDDKLDTNPLNLKNFQLNKLGFETLVKQGQRNFQGVILYNANLSHLNLSGLDFTDAQLEFCTLNNSSLIHNTFKNTNFKDAPFENTLYQDLPSDYIKLIDSTNPIQMCVNFLKEYSKKPTSSFSLFSHKKDKDFLTGVNKFLELKESFTCVKDMREKLQEICNKYITSKNDKLLHLIFTIPMLFESSADKNKPMKKEKVSWQF